MLENMLVALVKRRELRFAIAGGWNALFAYFVVIFMYEILELYLNIIFIAVIATVINIAQSFCVHKIFVFQTKGDWIKGLGKSYVVYGFSSVIGVASLWLLVDVFAVTIYLAQALVMVILSVVSYVGHLKFTFRN